MAFITKVWEFLDGKKTYIISILIGVLGIYVAAGHTVPVYVWIILNALGLGSVRNAIGGK